MLPRPDAFPPARLGRLRRAAARLSFMVGVGLALAACGPSESSEQAHLARGVAFYREGSDEQALVELREVLRLNPENGEALYHVGLIHERARRYAPAVASFQAAAATRANLVPDLARVGSLALSGGELDAAEQAARAIGATEGPHADGLALRAAVLLRRGELERARDLAEEALAAAPGHENATAVVVGVLAAKGRVDEGLATLDRALHANPSGTGLRTLEIALLERKRDPAAVVVAYEKLLALEPGHGAHRTAFAAHLVRQGEPARAEQVLREAAAAGLGGVAVQIELARLLHRRHGLAVAEPELLAMIERAPDAVALRFVLAELYAKSGKRDFAEAMLGEIVARAVGREAVNDARTVLARMRLDAGDAATARALADQVLRDHRTHRGAHLVAGLAALDGDASEQALKHARAALKRDPAWQPGLYLLAEAQARRGEHDAALAIWNRLVETAEEPAAALAARAMLRVRRGDWEAAQDDVDRLLGTPGQAMEASLLAGRLLTAQRRFAEGRGWFAQAERARPEAEAPRLAMVRSFVAEGKPAQALAYLEARTRERPDDAVAHGAMGELLAQQGRLAEAEVAFRTAIRLRPRWTTPYRQLGRALFAAGRADEGASVYEEAVRTNPGEASLLRELGERQLAASRFEEALVTYGRLVDGESADDVVVNNYAALVADFRFRDPALLDRALVLAGRFRDSANPFFLDSLGWLHHRKGDHGAALSYLRRAVEMAPDERQLRFHLGMALHALGRTARAAEELARATTDGPDYPDLATARSILLALREELRQVEPASGDHARNP